VEVGEGFEALGAVLWTALGHCQAENDVHNASVIMMLSQVRSTVPHCLCVSEHDDYLIAFRSRDEKRKEFAVIPSDCALLELTTMFVRF
jgi:hypothetical protein